MMKGLKALKRIKTFMELNAKHWKQDVGYIEKELKALDIIKEHKLLNYVLKNPKCAKIYGLSSCEIQKLKEVIYND